MKDINFLRGTYNFHTNPNNYVYHKGKPLIVFWGVGFSGDRRYSVAECK